MLLFLFQKGDWLRGRHFALESRLDELIDKDVEKMNSGRLRFVCFYSALMFYKSGDLQRANDFFQRMYNAEGKAKHPSLTILARTVEVLIEIRRKTPARPKGLAYYQKTVLDLRAAMEESGLFMGFNQLLWECLRSVEKAGAGSIDRKKLERLHAAAANAEHPEMNLLVAAWLAELFPQAVSAESP